MNTKITAVLVLAMGLLSGCGPGQLFGPTLTPTPTITPTFTLTFTPTLTPTPQATSTPTSTPLPTATFTPDVTATQLPEITPPAEGKGNVIGLVLWNNQPVPQEAVWLCEKFEGNCLGTYQYRASTDQNGYYVFRNVTPGRYIVAINSFSTSWFNFYFDARGSKEQTVAAGKNLILDPWDIWKLDLIIISPRYRNAVSNPHPTLKWETYPDAAYYQVSIYDKNFSVVLENKRVDGTDFTPEETLVSCEYYWIVEAFNTQGTKISQTKPSPANPYSNYFVFINIDLATSC